MFNYHEIGAPALSITYASFQMDKRHYCKHRRTPCVGSIINSELGRWSKSLSLIGVPQHLTYYHHRLREYYIVRLIWRLLPWPFPLILAVHRRTLQLIHDAPRKQAPRGCWYGLPAKSRRSVDLCFLLWCILLARGYDNANPQLR